MKEVSAKDLDHKSRSRTWSLLWNRNLSSYGFLVAFLVVNLQCKKSYPPPNVLPPVTQEGKNSFGCTINGEVWIPFYQCGLIEIPNHCKELQSVVTNPDTTGKLPIAIQLSVERELKPGGGSFSAFYIGATIKTTGSAGNFFDVIFFRDSLRYDPQYPISSVSNAINITKLDTVNQIISGTFYFTLYGPNGPAGGDSLVVTDGRFDITYNACLCH